MVIFLSIIVFIITLSVIIVIHELGHFIFAKRAGILCYEFSLGMGPKIWSKKKGETTYSIRAIPIGGYVQMAGEEGTGIILEDDTKISLDIDNDIAVRIYLYDKEDAQIRGTLKTHEIYKEMYLEIEDSENNIKRYNVKKDAMFVDEKGNEIQAAPYDRCFESKTILQRFLTIFAGPFMNFVLGLLVLIIYSFAVGTPDYDSTVVGTAQYSATEALVLSVDGVAADDETISLEGFTISEVNGVEVNKWNDISDAFTKTVKEGTSYDLTLTGTKDNKEYELLLKPYVFLGSLGLLTDLNEDSTNGVRVYLYCVNAENAGIIADYENSKASVVKKINDVVINDVDDLIKFSKDNVGSNIKMELINPDGQSYTVEYKMYDQKTVEKLDIGVASVTYGISPTMKTKFGKCLGNTFIYFKEEALTVFDTLNLLFTSKDVGVKNLSGPVGIYKLVSTAVSAGLLSYISLVAMLTINVGIVNLLPIPALDGGRLVFLLYEAVTKRKPNKKFEDTLNTIMFFLIMALFIYITFNDILRF